MPRRRFLHRDEMLRATGKMPARKEGEAPASFEKRKAVAASQVAKAWSLDQFQVDGTRALRYDEAQVDRAAEQHIAKLERAA